MPLYEYQCKKCGNITELLMKVDEKPGLCQKIYEGKKCEGILKK